MVYICSELAPDIPHSEIVLLLPRRIDQIFIETGIFFYFKAVKICDNLLKNLLQLINLLEVIIHFLQCPHGFRCNMIHVPIFYIIFMSVKLYLYCNKNVSL